MDSPRATILYCHAPNSMRDSFLWIIKIRMRKILKSCLSVSLNILRMPMNSARVMFSMLVDTTLKYRDMLRHSSGHTLTVEETRSALSAFMGVLKTHEVPRDLEPIIHDLVILWLEEMKAQKQN